MHSEQSLGGVLSTATLCPNCPWEKWTVGFNSWPLDSSNVWLGIAEWETRGHSTYKAYKFKAPIKKTLTMQETVSNQAEINII